MAVVTDPHGVQWNVHRRWWPFPDATDLVDLDWIVLSAIVAIPCLVLWPFWFAAKFVGVRWRIVVERDHTEVGGELVRGLGRSKRRIADLAVEIGQGRRTDGRFLL